MRWLLVLHLAFVVLIGLESKSTGQILLSESIDSIEYVLKNSSEKILSQSVENVFEDVSACSVETICQVSKVLKNTSFKNTMTHRRLSAFVAYKGKQTSNITATEECPMRNLLEKVRKCCKTQMSLLAIKLNKSKDTVRPL